MKRIMKLLLIPVLSMSLLFSANTMNVVATSVNAGATFWVEINIDNDDTFYGYQCDISYPSSFTDMDEAVASAREDGHTLDKGEPTSTEVRLMSYKIPTTAFEGSSGTVVSVKFQAPSSSGEYTFSLNEVSISDETGSGDICTGFSGATVTVNEVPTPIELTSFIAEMSAKGVKLSWETATETENDHFLIYRDDEVIGHVAGAGTTTEQHSYNFTDTQVLPGVHVYDLADVTYGGVEEKHPGIEIEVESEIQAASFKLNRAYPNPFNPSVTVNYQLSIVNEVRAFVYDNNGILVDELLNATMSAGEHSLTWDAQNMASGVYIVKLMVNNATQTRKVVLMK
ncbi:MAG: T9SS type A sorting domain-containing protein [Candidatus Marinimicrobia bacterium]|nr:T9SS type A sorting domain-containing protein [Candidatus Neomarinimicrobiota bacterium]